MPLAQLDPDSMPLAMEIGVVVVLAGALIALVLLYRRGKDRDR